MHDWNSPLTSWLQGMVNSTSWLEGMAKSTSWLEEMVNSTSWLEGMVNSTSWPEGMVNARLKFLFDLLNRRDISHLKCSTVLVCNNCLFVAWTKADMPKHRTLFCILPLKINNNKNLFLRLDFRQLMSSSCCHLSCISSFFRPPSVSYFWAYFVQSVLDSA